MANYDVNSVVQFGRLKEFGQGIATELSTMKEVSARVMIENNPEKAITLAVKGMLPHNSLGRQSLKKLRVYAGSEHENAAQKPEVWEVSK